MFLLGWYRREGSGGRNVRKWLQRDVKEEEERMHGEQDQGGCPKKREQHGRRHRGICGETIQRVRREVDVHTEWMWKEQQEMRWKQSLH